MICCAGGELLSGRETRDKYKCYLDAVGKAGAEAVNKRKNSEGTAALLYKPMMEDILT